MFRKHSDCVSVQFVWTPGGGGSPLYGLDGDVPLDMVWFSSSLSETGYIILPKSVLNGVHVLFPKQGNKIEAFVLNRVRVNLYPNIGRVPLPPPPPRPDRVSLRSVHAVGRRRNTSKVRITLQLISWLPQGRKKSGNFTSSQGKFKYLKEVREKWNFKSAYTPINFSTLTWFPLFSRRTLLV